MIPDLPLKVEPLTWSKELAQAIDSVAELLAISGLTKDDVDALENTPFPLRIPRSFAKKIKRGDPNDPILRQFLPTQKESWQTPGYGPDPVDETSVNPIPGLLHKFPNRVLLITTHSCAVHCRYCFRRHFPYEDNRQSRAQWAQAFDYIRANPLIEEVILSGGDPLNLTNAHLAWFLEQLDIPHVRLIRFHTRNPVVLPSRIDEGLIEILEAQSKRITMVTHVNHANELCDKVSYACDRLRKAGVTLLNQSVLLHQINDDPSTLKALSLALFECGITPYYLHMLDPIEGGAHFDVSQEQAKVIMGKLFECLPGYLIPTLVKETPGMAFKPPVDLHLARSLKN